MRTRVFAAATTAVAMLATSGLAAADSGEYAPATAAECFGLGCAEPGAPEDVPEARAFVPSVWGPTQLGWQTNAGFYEFGSGSFLGERAVAYVLPAGQADSMPPSVRDLPSVKRIAEPGGHPGFDFGTLVIFAPDAVLTIPQSELTRLRAAVADKRRVRARAAADDPWGCDEQEFCLYALDGWSGLGLTLGPQYHGTGWHRLSAFGFNDEANSMRNRRGNDSLLAEHWFGDGSVGGNGYCADSHSADDTFNGNAIGTNQASAFANVPDDIHC